jgi:AcrR family transcriptional regulator
MAKVLSSPSTSPRSLTVSDWVQVAVDALIEGGVAAVAVEPLAIRLGATKGSFYHHFENRDALINAALDAWELAQTEDIIQRLQLIPDPRERLRAVVTAAFMDRAGGVRDAALLTSATDPLIKPVVARVTARRLKYMTETYVQMGMPKAQARRRALLLYTSYLGAYEYLRVGLDDLSDAELGSYTLELLNTLVPPMADGDNRSKSR